jgi:hypothetical protein
MTAKKLDRKTPKRAPESKPKKATAAKPSGKLNTFEAASLKAEDAIVSLVGSAVIQSAVGDHAEVVARLKELGDFDMSDLPAVLKAAADDTASVGKHWVIPLSPVSSSGVTTHHASAHAAFLSVCHTCRLFLLTEPDPARCEAFVEQLCDAVDGLAVEIHRERAKVLSEAQKAQALAAAGPADYRLYHLDEDATKPLLTVKVCRAKFKEFCACPLNSLGKNLTMEFQANRNADPPTRLKVNGVGYVYLYRTVKAVVERMDRHHDPDAYKHKHERSLP